MLKKPLKTELHHWWPRTLSEHWRAPDLMVSVIRPNGEVTRAPAGAFGAITNAHHLKRGGPWDSTFEPIFNQPDDEISDFINWLFTLETSGANTDQPALHRIMAQPLDDKRRGQMARITASLLARSPGIRNTIRITTEYYRGRLGLADPKADKILIAANQSGLYDAYGAHLMNSGRWAVIFSDSKEFIAGDGFLHNFPATRDGLGSGLKLILPILPTAAIVYMRPVGPYPSEPRLVTFGASQAEVSALNDIVQVYASGVLFFRAEQPVLTEGFKVGDHRQFEYHQCTWLDALLDDLSQYNLWGINGTPGMCSRRPYSGPSDGDRMLGRFS